MSTKKEDLAERIADLKTAIEEKERDLELFEIDCDDQEDKFKSTLNRSGPINICGIKFDPAYALKELDPTAYDCNLSDYVAGLDRTDDPKYIEIQNELRSMEDELGDIESEYEDLEDEDDV